MKLDFFNIYYINISKVYELAMIENNTILSSLEKETINRKESSFSRNSKIQAGYDEFFGASVSDNIANKKYNSSKITETLEVKSTKSILLRNILDKCIQSKKVKYNIGDLVFLDDVYFSLDNEEEVRTFKLIRNNAIKGITYEGLDLNNLFNSVIRDYSYLLSGNSKTIKNILIKIPMTTEDEFENMYTIDDLTIGKVSLIGIYRGNVKKENLKNTFSSLNETTENNSFEFDNSDNELNKKEDSLEDKNKEYEFFDVIAIIQRVNTKNQESIDNISSENVTKECWIKSLLKRIRGWKK